jgi:Resolvase, N terminal domain
VSPVPAGRARFQVMGVFARFERAMIVERVKAGLKRAKENKRLGRPRIAEKVERAIRRELAKGKGIHTVARTLWGRDRDGAKGEGSVMSKPACGKRGGAVQRKREYETAGPCESPGINQIVILRIASERMTPLKAK